MLDAGFCFSCHQLSLRFGNNTEASPCSEVVVRATCLMDYYFYAGLWVAGCLRVDDFIRRFSVIIKSEHIFLGSVRVLVWCSGFCLRFLFVAV